MNKRNEKRTHPSQSQSTSDENFLKDIVINNYLLLRNAVFPLFNHSNLKKYFWDYRGTGTSDGNCFEVTFLNISDVSQKCELSITLQTLILNKFALITSLCMAILFSDQRYQQERFSRTCFLTALNYNLCEYI